MTRAALVLSTLAVLALASCGGDEKLSKSEYEEKVRSVYGEVQEAFRRTNVTSSTELADRVGDAQAELRDAADELDGVQPPQEVEAENAQIAQGMRAYAEDLDHLREAAEREDTRAIADFNVRIGQNRSVKLIAEAAEKMKFKGYDLGQIAEE